MRPKRPKEWPVKLPNRLSVSALRQKRPSVYALRPKKKLSVKD